MIRFIEVELITYTGRGVNRKATRSDAFINPENINSIHDRPGEDHCRIAFNGEHPDDPATVVDETAGHLVGRIQADS